MPVLSDTLRLFGQFQLVCSGEQIILGQPRLEEVVAWIAVRPGVVVTRAEIAYQLWPDSREKQARTNTRNLLYKLKIAWPSLGDSIAITRTDVCWRLDAAVDVDVHRFDALYDQAQQSQSSDERARLLTAAADCYEDDLLPTCYSDWALEEREELRTRYERVLDSLIDALLDLRRHEDALRRVKQLRDHDPLLESTYRRLMRVYTERGDRAAALRTYHTCATTLKRELGVEPSPETAQLHAQLLQRNAVTAHEDRATDGPQAVSKPHLVGRHTEWQQLRRIWSEAGSGRAQCVIIWGEAGIGKTRLAEEMIDWVRRQGDAWASSRSYAAQGALTYAPIAEWLHAPSIAPALDTMDDLWRVEVARLQPGLLANRPDLPYPGPLTEAWQQQRFFQSFVQALQGVPGPLLLHLDDMQWSDQETLSLMQFLLQSAPTHPLLIVGTVRTEDVINPKQLGAFVEALQHSNQLTELQLEPLSPADVAELAAQTSDEPVSLEMAQSLYAASEGHPLYLIETVRSGLSEETQPGGNLARVHDTIQPNGDTTILPKIYNLISARLGQLSPLGRQVANTAAVIGRKFTYRVLLWTISADELSLVDALDELWARRIVREQDGDSYDFSHDRIREVAYQEISRARRRLLHRRVADALEAIHADDIDGVVGELAVHCAQAGDGERAYRYYRRAANIAINQHALSHAEAMFDAALAHAPDDPVDRYELLAEQSRVFYSSLQLHRWRSNLDEQEGLLASMPQPDQHLKFGLHVDRSHFFSTTGAGEEAIEAALSAVAIAKKLDDKEMLALAYQELANGYWFQSRMAEAKPVYGQSVTYAREVENETIEATSLEMHAASGMFSGMPSAQILELINRAYHLAEMNGDLQKMSILLNKFGYLRIASGMGDFDAAVSEYERGLALSRQIGDLRTEETLLSNLGVCFTNKGGYRRALDTLNTCLALSESHPIYWRRLISRHYLGSLFMQMGRLDDGRSELIQVSEHLSAQGNRHFEVKVRCDLGLLLHLAGEDHLAQEELLHVLTLIEGHGDLRFEALVSTRLGYALEATGRLADAMQMYDIGYDLHRQMAQDYYALNALAGSARVGDLLDDSASALAHAQTIWSIIAGKETDATVETTRTLRTCYTIFRQQDDPQAEAVLDTACTQLRRRADSIDDPDHVALFWQLADHRFFQEAMGSAAVR